MQIQFWVPGIPATAGSKTPFIYKDKKSGKNRVAMSPANKRQKPWMADVKYHAGKEMGLISPLTGAVILKVQFQFMRPRSHFGSGRNAGQVKASAPKYHITKPDLTKLTRAVEDALRGVIYRDDSQVVAQRPTKRYSEAPGALITIMEVD